MKEKFAALILFAAVLAPAYADVVVQDVLVRRQGSNVNVRVNIVNPATTAQKGPIIVELSVRPDEASAWTPIKTWNDIANLKAGNRVSRDYFDENNTILKGLAENGKFQARATVKAPGLKETAERTSWYDTETGN